MGEGRYLIVWSADNQMHCFPHPDPMLNGQADLTVPAQGEITVDLAWLRVPSFVNAQRQHWIAYRRDSEPAQGTALSVPEDLVIDSPTLRQVAETIINTPWSDISTQLILIEEGRGRNSRVTKEYLLTTHLRFLQYILWREQQKPTLRAEVIAILEQRIKELRAL
jgi:hypothetical protein